MVRRVNAAKTEERVFKCKNISQAMGHSVLSTTILRYSTFQSTDTKGVAFTHVVRLEAWNPAEKARASACEALRLFYSLFFNVFSGIS